MSAWDTVSWDNPADGAVPQAKPRKDDYIVYVR